jgi:nucleoside-diphosphate kinase
MEKILIILKPDAVKRKLMGEIVQRIESKGFDITHMKMTRLSREIVAEHYAFLSEKSFFNSLLDYMCSGNVVLMVVEGNNVISMMRTLIGKTMVDEAAPGTIRGDYGYDRNENLIHGSDSPENAEIEFARFFPEEK